MQAGPARPGQMGGQEGRGTAGQYSHNPPPFRQIMERGHGPVVGPGRGRVVHDGSEGPVEIDEYPGRPRLGPGRRQPVADRLAQLVAARSGPMISTRLADVRADAGIGAVAGAGTSGNTALAGRPTEVAKCCASGW